MTREDIRINYPSLFRFFEGTTAEHPFWSVVFSDIKNDIEGVSLPVLERMADAAPTMNGGATLRDMLLRAGSHAEFMQRIAEWYVAYLYRDHSLVVRTDNAVVAIELSISNQIVVITVVGPSTVEHKSMHIHDTIADVPGFMQRIKPYTAVHAHHPHAHHRVVATLVQAPTLQHEHHLRSYLKDHRAECMHHFPHTSGVILVHANTHKEAAVCVPFHSDVHDIEWMLTKES